MVQRHAPSARAVGIHPSNRDGLGINTLEAGFVPSLVHAVATEIDGREQRQWNETLCHPQEVWLGLGGRRSAYVGGGHTNFMLRCFLDGVQHEEGPVTLNGKTLYMVAFARGLVDFLEVKNKALANKPSCASSIPAMYSESKLLLPWERPSALCAPTQCPAPRRRHQAGHKPGPQVWAALPTADRGEDPRQRRPIANRVGANAPAWRSVV